MATDAPTGSALSITNLVAGYEEIIVLKNVDVDVPRGKVMTIIGANGAGKSTLLKAIFGLAKIYSGSIVHEGEPIERLASDARLRRGLALVLQGRVNFPLMTVRENLEMGAFLRRDGEVQRDVDGMLELFPLLSSKRRDLAGNLSGGQQQVLEMAMALMLHPTVLMLDEPSLGLSPKTMDEIFETILEINRRGTTILMVEQNAKKALSVSHHAIVLDLGQKRFEGTGEAILNDPQVKRAYLGG